MNTNQREEEKCLCCKKRRTNDWPQTADNQPNSKLMMMTSTNDVLEGPAQGFDDEK